MIALCHREALHYNTKATNICTDHFIMYLYGQFVQLTKAIHLIVGLYKCARLSR